MNQTPYIDREEQARYVKRLCQHAEEAGMTIQQYQDSSRHRYVVLSKGDQPEHWADEFDLVAPPEEDETNWCVYNSRAEAEEERQLLISEKDFGHRVVTERYFLKIKGLL